MESGRAFSISILVSQLYDSSASRRTVLRAHVTDVLHEMLESEIVPYIEPLLPSQTAQSLRAS
jgi:hypothetical protein